MKKQLFWFLLTFLAGFSIGIIFINICNKQFSYAGGYFPYYISKTDWTDFGQREYFLSLLWKRGSLFCLYLMLGMSFLGIPIVFLSLLAAGFLGGGMTSLFLLTGGIKGMLLGVAALFPQCLFYIPTLGCLFLIMFSMSKKYWTNRAMDLQDYKSYFFFALLIGCVLMLGIASESYVNIHIIRYVQEYFKNI